MPKKRRGANKWSNWRFEPSYCRPPVVVECVTQSDATDTYLRSMRSSWFEDLISPPVYTSAPAAAAADHTHDRLFGTDPPAAVVHRRRNAAGDSSCNGPRWSPTECPRPPSVDDFTRTQRNIHGDEHDQPTLKPAAPADFNEPRTTILGPHLPLPDCCPYSGTFASPVEFERTKYNIVGPQSPTPLHFPPRTNDFVNSSRNLFGPATTAPLRFPRRTSDFDDSRRSLFGPHSPLSTRPSLRQAENTFSKLFGETSVAQAPRIVTPPRARRQNINVLSMTGRPDTPRRLQLRPENSFGNTYHHLFGTETSVIQKRQHRQV